MAGKITAEAESRREAILRYIDAYRRTRGWSPSYKEIMAEVGISSLSHMSYHLTGLERRGLLFREPNQARAMRLTKRGRALIESQ